MITQNNAMLKSPLRYPGGKSRAIKILKDYFPKDFTEYREPFFGDGNVGLYLLQTKQNLKMSKKKILKNLYLTRHYEKYLKDYGRGKACKIKRFQRELRQKCFSFSVFGTKPSPYKSIKSEDTLSL